MISLELIYQYLLALTETPNLSKAEKLKIFEILNQFHSIHSEFTLIKRTLLELADAKHLNRYIELDDNKVYCLHNNKVYDANPISYADSSELIELEKEIEDRQTKLDDYIEAEEERIAELFDLLVQKRKQFTSIADRQKAVNSDGFVFINKDNNFFYSIDKGE